MQDVKKAKEKTKVKKKLPKKSIESGKVSTTVVDKDVLPILGAADPMPCNFCLGEDNKTFLTVYPDGRMVFDKNNFPAWKEDNFARTFVALIEEITGYKKK